MSPRPGTLPAPSYRDVVVADGPVGYWRLGEPSGTTAAAERGPAGGYAGAPVFGRPGLINDPDTSVDLADGAVYVPLAIPQLAYSLEVWARKTGTGSDQGILGSFNGNGPMLWLEPGGTFMLVHGADGNHRISAGAPVVGTAYHVVGTFDGTTGRIYLDGTEVASKPFGGPAGDSGLPLRVSGYSASGALFAGELDEAAVYDYALSAAQVAEHHEVGTAGAAAPPVPRLLRSRTAIVNALIAGGVNAATTGRFSAPCVLVEAGDPWASVESSLGRRRVGRWRLYAIAGRADSDGVIELLAELVDQVDRALLKLPGIQLPTWSRPINATVGGVAYAATETTIQYATNEEDPPL